MQPPKDINSFIAKLSGADIRKQQPSARDVMSKIGSILAAKSDLVDSPPDYTSAMKMTDALALMFKTQKADSEDSPLFQSPAGSDLSKFLNGLDSILVQHPTSDPKVTFSKVSKLTTDLFSSPNAPQKENLFKAFLSGAMDVSPQESKDQYLSSFFNVLEDKPTSAGKLQTLAKKVLKPAPKQGYSFFSTAADDSKFGGGMLVSGKTIPPKIKGFEKFSVFSTSKAPIGTYSFFGKASKGKDHLAGIAKNIISGTSKAASLVENMLVGDEHVTAKPATNGGGGFSIFSHSKAKIGPYSMFDEKSNNQATRKFLNVFQDLFLGNEKEVPLVSQWASKILVPDAKTNDPLVKQSKLFNFNLADYILAEPPHKETRHALNAHSQQATSDHSHDGHRASDSAKDVHHAENGSHSNHQHSHLPVAKESVVVKSSHHHLENAVIEVVRASHHSEKSAKTEVHSAKKDIKARKDAYTLTEYLHQFKENLDRKHDRHKQATQGPILHAGSPLAAHSAKAHHEDAKHANSMPKSDHSHDHRKEDTQGPILHGENALPAHSTNSHHADARSENGLPNSFFVSNDSNEYADKKANSYGGFKLADFLASPSSDATEPKDVDIGELFRALGQRFGKGKQVQKAPEPSQPKAEKTPKQVLAEFLEQFDIVAKQK